MHAFVLDKDRKPLTPCRMARARILLKLGSGGGLIRRFPFTIILQDRADDPHRPRAPDQDRSRLEDDRRCDRPGGDRASRRRGRDRASGTGRQGVPRRPSGPPPRPSGPQDALPPASVRQPHATGGLAATVARKPDRQRAHLGRPAPVVSARSPRRRKSWSGSTSRKSRIPRSRASRISKARSQATSCGSTCSRSGDRTCAYCGKKDVPLQIEHIHPQEQGRNRPRLATSLWRAQPCNRRKGNKPVEDFLKKDPERLKRIKARPRPRLRTPRRSMPPAGSCSVGSRRRACRSRAGREAGPSSTARHAACPRRTGWMPRASGPAPRRRSWSKACGPCWSRRAGKASARDRT